MIHPIKRIRGTGPVPGNFIRKNHDYKKKKIVTSTDIRINTRILLRRILLKRGSGVVVTTFVTTVCDP